MTGFTFDAGALIALDRYDRRVLQILRRVAERKLRITIPATALAQAIRNPARQAAISRLLRDRQTEVIPLDADGANAVGLLLAQTRTSDIVDAHVVLCAERAGQPIVTSDPADLHRLSPTVSLVEV